MSGKKSYNGITDIPSGSRKMVQSLKEIVNCCPEAEIYAVLKDCNMDPNEAVNRLLSQGFSPFFFFFILFLSFSGSECVDDQALHLFCLGFQTRYSKVSTFQHCVLLIELICLQQTLCSLWSSLLTLEVDNDSSSFVIQILYTSSVELLLLRVCIVQDQIWVLDYVLSFLHSIDFMQQPLELTLEIANIFSLTLILLVSYYPDPFHEVKSKKEKKKEVKDYMFAVALEVMCLHFQSDAQ